MKLKIFILALLASVCLSARVGAQNWLPVSDSTIMTNADTNIVYFLTLNKGKTDLWAFSIHILSDSLTGATAGTLLIQGTDDGSTWYTLKDGAGSNMTLTLNGAAQQSQVWTGTMYCRRMRLNCITSGTQTTRVRLKSTLKKVVAP